MQTQNTLLIRNIGRNYAKQGPGSLRLPHLNKQGFPQKRRRQKVQQNLIPNQLPRILLYGKFGFADPILTPINPESDK